MSHRGSVARSPAEAQVDSETRSVSGLCVAASRRDAQTRRRTAKWVDRAVYATLCFVVVAAPHDVHIARAAFYVGFIFWIAALITARRRLRVLPLTLPILTFLCLAALAASFSFAPLLSWTRIGWFAMAALWLVVAQTVTSSTRSKILVVLILASSMVSVARTGWQYLHGIGAELATVEPDTLLYRDGLRSGDVIQAINGRATRTPQAFRKAWSQTAGIDRLRVRIARSAPTQYAEPVISRKHLEQWLSLPQSRIIRGRPVRAQGHFYHYIPYAGMLTEIALLAFGLLLMAPRAALPARLVLALVFVSLVAALLATVTRTYVAVLLLGCFAEFLLARRDFRLAGVALLVLCLIGATFWMHKERGYGWLASSDPGTDYRLLMWKTAAKLVPQHPWVGIGPDSIMAFGDLWKIEAYEKYPLRSHFHSTYVELAVDCGLPCLGAWLWLLIAYGVVLRRSWRSAESADWFTRGTLAGISGGAVAFAAASFVHYNLGDGEVMIFMWLFMGIATALSSGRLFEVPRSQ
jgi:hypothetical protein